jgi:hypothetical protein
MSVRYVLAMNVKSDIADNIGYQNLDVTIRNALSARGLRVEGPHSTKHSIDGSFLVRRSLISVSLSVVGTDVLSVAQTRDIDSAIVQSIANNARVPWIASVIVSGLSGQGDSSYRVGWLPTADITEVQRAVARGEGVPQTTITNPVTSTTVQETTDPSIVPGTRTQSGASDAIDEAARLLREAAEKAKRVAEENKYLLYGGLAVVGVTAVAVIVVKVK